MTWTNLLHYSGQILLVIAAAELLLLVLRVREANLRLRVLQSALLLCLLLPIAQPRVAAAGGATLREAADASATAAILRTAERSLSVTVIWATGGALLALRIAAGLIGLRRLRRRSKQFKQRGRVPVRLVNGLPSPVAFGIFRPIVLLPEQAASLDRPTLEPMIAHELAHISRRDWAFVLAEEIVRAALWFHPGVWWLLARIRTARELAVDASVTAATGAEAYSESLLAAARWRTSASSPQQPLTAIAMYRGGSLRRRLHLIQTLQEHQMTRIHRAAAIGALSFAALGAAVLATSALPLFAAQEQEDVVKPKVIRKAVTPYPPAAKEQRVQGTVVLDVTVGKDGKVVNITAKSGHPILVEAAVESVREWEFEPARKNGEPVEFTTSIEVNFTLSK